MTTGTEEPTPTFDLSAVVVPLLKGVTYRADDAAHWHALLQLQGRVRDHVAVLGLQTPPTWQLSEAPQITGAQPLRKNLIGRVVSSSSAMNSDVSTFLSCFPELTASTSTKPATFGPTRIAMR